jgi:hypothetical protein
MAKCFIVKFQGNVGFLIFVKPWILAETIKACSEAHGPLQALASVPCLAEAG